MKINLLSRLNLTDFRPKPFPHYVIHNALPHDIYVRLQKSFPEQFICSGNPAVVDDRCHTRRLLADSFSKINDLDPLWIEFAENHTSQEFFNSILYHFLAESISFHYPSLFSYLKYSTVSLRSQTDPPVFDTKQSASFKNTVKCETDFQLVANLKSNDNFSSRTPHLDSPKELYALLYYMRQPDDQSIGGGLDFYQRLPSAVNAIHGTDRSVNPSFLRYRYTVPYEPNTLVLFLNTSLSYHGVQPIFNQHMVRRSVNIIGELPYGLQLFDL